MNGVHDLGGTDGLGLAGTGALSDATLDDRTKAVLATPRDAGHHVANREPVAVDPAR